MFQCRSRFFALKRVTSLILTISFSVLLGIHLLCAQTIPVSTEATRLEVGKLMERSLAGGQDVQFRIELAANQFAHIDVEQQGVDVVVHIIGSDGKRIIDFNDDPTLRGTEDAEIAVRDAGVITLTIEPTQKTASPGRITVQLAEVRAATDKDLTLFDARQYVEQATALWRAGKYDEALPLAQKATDITKKELGEDSLEYGRALFVLANIYSDNGGLDKAAELYKKGIELKEKAVGKDHISMTSILNNYAIVLKDKGDYPASAAILERVLDIRTKALGPDHLLVASTLLNLGNAYRLMNDTKAVDLYRRALEIRQRNLPPDHPDIATVLNNIADTYDDVEHAEPLYKQALSIREKAFGPESSEVAQTLYNFAVMYSTAGDYAKAEDYCRRSLAIFEKVVGPDHYYTSYPVSLLGGIEKMEGRFVEAEAAFKRAIAIKEKLQGPYHPDLGGVLMNLANLYMATGETEKAIAAQTRANEIVEFNTTLNMSVGSERQKIGYLKTLGFNQDQTLTLSLRFANKDQKAADLAITTVLRRKGRVLDAVSDSMVALRNRLDDQGRTTVERLNDVTTKLAALVINGPAGGSIDAYRRQVDDLTTQREEIENRVSNLGKGYFSVNGSVTLDAVRNAIPEDAALIEFALYHPVDPKAFTGTEEVAPDRQDPRTARYVVCVLHHSGDVRWLDLGEASAIESQIRELRNALRDPKRNDVNTLARSLDGKVIEPIREVLGNAKHLLISPEGGLNLVPFEALIGQDKKYLIEDYRITYLTGGSDLLRMGQTRTTKAPPMIIANPAYGSPDGKMASIRSTGGRSVTATRSLSDTYFAPLSATAQEGQSIKALFPDATLLVAEQASKASLKKAVSPRMLHIETHGFFLTDEDLGKTRGRGGKPVISRALMENPLARSGLALAGANRRAAGNDGIMSALEASGLDLWGTKLVVLSACDTGVGEVKTGEGVYGLRRSFVEAGAESLVMSLWPVSDVFTRDLMISYYKNLKQGIGRGEALRQVQLATLKRPDRRHPFYWASFIQTGEWANLEGKR